MAKPLSLPTLEKDFITSCLALLKEDRFELSDLPAGTLGIIVSELSVACSHLCSLARSLTHSLTLSLSQEY